MARVRWCGRSVVLGVFCTFWIFTAGVSTECWYDDEKHEEGSEVETAEPCLNCTCSRGALLCYLRVCPRLPNPPPPGCILLHKFRTCCPELICAELPGGENTIEARSDSDLDLDMPYDITIGETACIANGSIYGSGSAIDSSSLCEYCYCLRGKQTCVKPKCLLSIDGCTPIFETTSCCPIHYKCTAPATSRVKFLPTSSTTTTTTLKANVEGCSVDGLLYPEGGKVLGVGYSVCDNCYCLRGLLRCEPLSCAPPLLGCTPVIKPGECCAASYNCNGTIDIQPEPNYGLFPIVSKEYAKLRKEVHRKPTTSRKGVVTVPPFYVLAESVHPFTTNKVHQRSPDTFGTTRHFTGVPYNPSSPKPFYYNTINKEKSTTDSYPDAINNQKVHHATTNYEFDNIYYKRINLITTPKPLKSILVNKIYRNVNDQISTTVKFDATTSSTETTTENIEHTTLGYTTIGVGDDKIPLESRTTTEIDDTENSITTTENLLTSTSELETNNSYPIILKTILQSTDCVYNDSYFEHTNKIEVTTLLPVDPNAVNNLAELKDFNEYLSTAEFEDGSTESTTEYDDIVDRIASKEGNFNDTALRNVPNLPLHLQAMINISKNKKDNNDYEFDYNEPTLPPSLPNLRIIPFVAADALDSSKEVSKNNVYAEGEKESSFIYINLFSPPVETEGGFVPKNPPILDNFYENAVTASTVISSPEVNGGNCDSNGEIVSHGSSVPSMSPCTTCTCFYGNIVCQEATCPMARPGCKKPSAEVTLCCPNYICENPETPTMVLEPLEVLSPPKPASPDPFHDVIRTEPAPNLQSLIVDMRTLLHPETTTPLSIPTTNKMHTSQTTTEQLSSHETTSETFDDMSLDKVLELLFSVKNDEQIKHPSSTTEKVRINKIQTTISTTKTTDGFSMTSPSEPSLTERSNEHKATEKGVDSEFKNLNGSVGLLKLAGCNIYGRMYRVGRIISELSNPCLECKCTEVGVQCRDLKC